MIHTRKSCSAWNFKRSRMRVSQIIKQTFSEDVRADTKREGSIEGRHELVLPSLQTSALRCRQNALKPGTQGPRRSPKQRWHKNEQRTQYISVYREELWAHGTDACSLPFGCEDTHGIQYSLPMGNETAWLSTTIMYNIIWSIAP